jgi:hypothetical protein
MRDRMGWGAAGFNQPEDREIVLDEIHITGEGPDPEPKKNYMPVILGVAAAGVAILLFRRRA